MRSVTTPQGRVTFMLEPYYQDDYTTIYHGDCRDVLPQLAPVDLVLTDPPYGIQDAPFAGGIRGGKRIGGDNAWHPPSDWDDSVNPEWCKAVCCASDSVIWFGHWRKRAEVEAAMAYPIRAEIVWAKDCHVGPPCPVAMQDERIWVFSRTGFVGQCFETSVWREPIIPTWEHKFHKNQKPNGLMKRLVRWAAPQSGAILDPFMGSGTTLRAAKDLGVKSIGIEIEEKYCEIAAKRLRQEVLWAAMIE